METHTEFWRRFVESTGRELAGALDEARIRHVLERVRRAEAPVGDGPRGDGAPEDAPSQGGPSPAALRLDAIVEVVRTRHRQAVAAARTWIRSVDARPRALARRLHVGTDELERFLRGPRVFDLEQRAERTRVMELVTRIEALGRRDHVVAWRPPERLAGTQDPEHLAFETHLRRLEALRETGPADEALRRIGPEVESALDAGERYRTYMCCNALLTLALLAEKIETCRLPSHELRGLIEVVDALAAEGAEPLDRFEDPLRRRRFEGRLAGYGAVARCWLGRALGDDFEVGRGVQALLEATRLQVDEVDAHWANLLLFVDAQVRDRAPGHGRFAARVAAEARRRASALGLAVALADHGLEALRDLWSRTARDVLDGPGRGGRPPATSG